jgi:hypothetical protein
MESSHRLDPTGPYRNLGHGQKWLELAKRGAAGNSDLTEGLLVKDGSKQFLVAVKQRAVARHEIQPRRPWCDQR